VVFVVTKLTHICIYDMDIVFVHCCLRLLHRDAWRHLLLSNVLLSKVLAVNGNSR